MAYNFNQTKEGVKKVNEWLVRELGTIRTGRATPALLDGVMVDSYGSKTQITHVAAISIEDAKTLRVTPWDKSQIKSIETAIAASNLGVSSIPDASGVRVICPDVTADRRKVLLKLINEKTEEAKVSLRGEREKTWNDIQKREKEGEMSEDDKFKCKDELQKMIDEGQRQLLAISEKKQHEIEN
ncbi:MAG: ribosome recycling factor [Candidatus Vogelbacteria bacterium]|nr:ribosome recycling factor [Candidatus Vogelbacteria bacterium]